MKDDIDLGLSNLSDDDLLDRYANGYYSDTVIPQVIEELTKRNLQIPEITPQKDEYYLPFRKRHPILFIFFLIICFQLVFKAIKSFYEQKSHESATSIMQKK